jgi:hypothetical protein
MTSRRQGIWGWAKRQLREGIVRARLRAEVERSRPLWQRILRQSLRLVLELYVVINLLLVFWVEVVFAWRIEYRVVDAATGAPVAGALVWSEDYGQRLVTDVAGSATERWTGTARLWWALPAIGRLADVGRRVHVEADGYREQDVQVGEQLAGMWVCEPHGIVAVRLQKS